VIPQTSPARKFNPSTGGQKQKLSDAQKKIADAFGMSAEEYLENSKFNTDIVSQLGGR
jgi:hypothetical protein